jgi:hypothetical protein
MDGMLLAGDECEPLAPLPLLPAALPHAVAARAMAATPHYSPTFGSLKDRPKVFAAHRALVHFRRDFLASPAKSGRLASQI